MTTQSMLDKYPGQLPENFQPEFGHGWKPLFETLLHMIQVHSQSQGINPPIITRAKEKLGTLRVSCGSKDPKVSGYIEMAWAISAHTCEICGCPGKGFSEGGWQRTRCAEHADAPVPL